MGSQKVIDWRQRTKENCVRVMGSKCELCGLEGEMIEVYDFHHMNPKEKTLGIAQMMKNCTSWETICNELRKCVLLCSNCHRKVEYSQKEIIFEKSSFNEEINCELILAKDHSNKCQLCGKVISPKAKLCQSCSSKTKTNRNVDEIPTKEELKSLIRDKSFCEIGRIFNVSDNAIKKWCKKRDLPSTKKEINSYSDLEWQNI